MQLEQIAALAEIFGFVIVIASLVYVAQQLRQTTAIMRVNASVERVERDTDIITSLVESREVADYWMKGISDFGSLDETDRQRLIFFERRALLHWHNMYGLREQNLVTDADWYELQWIIRNIGSRQSVREAWKVFRDSFQPPFQEFVERQFSIADAAVEP
jgi:hypothetical protein